MRRATYPRVFSLIGLNRNTKTGDYDITEDDITYSMSLEMTRLLKKYCSGNDKATVSDWYSSLNRDDKKEVTRAGDIEGDAEPFYGDPIYE